MKQFNYIKSNAFTSQNSEGNPAAALFLRDEVLSPSEMQQVASEHKGFVMETVFCSKSDCADCKLTYYSSECEVDFCGHGTIATMYSYIKENPNLLSRPVLEVETNRKGVINVYNEIESEDAVYIEAPAPIEYPVTLSASEISKALSLPRGSIDTIQRIRIIDAGLRTLIVPISSLEREISVYPDINTLKSFCLKNDIDIILIFSFEVEDMNNFAHTRVFAPKYGYLEDPATGSGNSAFANYLLSENLWNGSPITIEQGGDDRIYNAVKLKTHAQKVLFGGRATKKIEGGYYI
ncbi:MAG: PhzF family phenazine biosynthesis protein [Bacteroidia bacterium]|nr:PhzF family phenazine biosynthesis protein [Bacteroidia bacterium]